MPTGTPTIDVVDFEGSFMLRVFSVNAVGFDAPGPAYKTARTLRQLTSGLENYAPAPRVVGRAVVVGDVRRLCRTAADARLIADLVSRFFCFASDESPKHRVPLRGDGTNMTFLLAENAERFAAALAEARQRAGFAPADAVVVELAGTDSDSLRFGVEFGGVLLPVRLDRRRATGLVERLSDETDFSSAVSALSERFAPA